MAKLPGQSVQGSNSGRPVMVLLDALGKRWALRVIWELSKKEACTFRELRAQCEDVSPTSLNQRLKDLRELDLIKHGAEGYALTRHGRSLGKHLLPLDRWANEWAKTLQDSGKK